jgi:hypothetical protein
VIDKVKSHISRHKVAYSFGSGIAFAGITCIIMRGRHAGILRVPEEPLKAVFVRPLFLFSNHNKINVVAVVLRDGRGHPGYPVICKETGDLFLSQTGAARWAGISDWYMSQHLRGNLPHVQGWTFERVAAIPAIAA